MASPNIRAVFAASMPASSSTNGNLEFSMRLTRLA
jgi:hypothetical protein